MSIGIATQPGQFAAAAAGSGGPWSPPAGLTEWHYGSATEAGGEWTDRSGNGNHATLNGSASVGANGLTGGASSSDYAAIAATIATSDTYTLAAWVYLAAGLTQDMGMFGLNSGTSSAFWMDVVSGPVWRGGTFNGGTTSFASTSGDTRGSWVHIAFSASSGTVTHYRNGSANGTGTAPTISSSSLQTVGTSDAAKLLRSGFLDDVMIYNTTALSAAQIADVYNNSPGSRA